MRRIIFLMAVRQCNHGGKDVDLWRAALGRGIRMSIVPRWVLARLGAAQTNLVMPIESGKYYQVDLTEPGVPANAKILARNYTGRNDDMTAVEWYANAPPLRFPGTTLRLLGVPLGESLLPRVGRVLVSTWCQCPTRSAERSTE